MAAESVKESMEAIANIGIISCLSNKQLFFGRQNEGIVMLGYRNTTIDNPSDSNHSLENGTIPVSYTHLTLPTKLEV